MTLRFAALTQRMNALCEATDGARSHTCDRAFFAAVHSCGFPFDRGTSCSAGREQVIYIERLARSMGSDDDMFRIWSGPEGSSHKEPLSGIRIHRARYFCAVLPNRAMLDAARHPGRQFVIQKAGHDQKVNALPFSCQLVRPGCRSLALPKHRGSRDSGIMGQRLAGPRLCLRDRSTTKQPAGTGTASSKNHP